MWMVDLLNENICLFLFFYNKKIFLDIFVQIFKKKYIYWSVEVLCNATVFNKHFILGFQPHSGAKVFCKVFCILSSRVHRCTVSCTWRCTRGSWGTGQKRSGEATTCAWGCRGTGARVWVLRTPPILRTSHDWPIRASVTTVANESAVEMMASLLLLNCFPSWFSPNLGYPVVC